MEDWDGTERKVLQYVHEKMELHDGSHDLEHACRVARNVSSMTAAPHLSHLCAIAALVHDTCDRKYVADKENALTELTAFLNSTLSSKDDVLVIIMAVREVSYSKLRNEGPPVSLDSLAFAVWRLVSDADMLEAMGLVGVIRTLMYQGSVHESLDAALDYASKTLVTCADFIKNDRASDEAKRRRATMRLIIRQMQMLGSKERNLGHCCITAGRRRAKFNDTMSKMKRKRFWTTWAESQFCRETEWTTSSYSYAKTSRAVSADRQCPCKADRDRCFRQLPLQI